jgi:hypothetical protein
MEDFGRVAEAEAKQPLAHFSIVKLRGVDITCPIIPHATELQDVSNHAVEMGLQFRLDRASSFLQHIFTSESLPADYHERIILAATDQKTHLSTKLGFELVALFKLLFPGLEKDDIVVRVRANRSVIPRTFEALEAAGLPLPEGPTLQFNVTGPGLAIAVRAIEV